MGTILLVIVVLVAGISIGFMLGFSRAIREATSNSRGTNRPTIGRIFIGFGCVALIAGLAAALHTWQFTRIAVRANGTVIEMRTQTDHEGSTSYFPTYRFQDASGSQHTVPSSFGSSPPAFHVDQAVGVLYRSDNPQSARIDTFWQVWGLASLLGIMGSVQLPVGLVVLLWPKIRSRQLKP